MNSFSTRMCRLCLESRDDVVNIFGNFENSTIASVLTQHFWFQVSKDDGFSEYLCQACWINTKTFHNFYKRVERRQKGNWQLAETHVIKQEPLTLEPNLSLVKREIAEPPVSVIDFQVSKEEGSDYTDDYSCDPSENLQMEFDVGDSNFIECRSPLPTINYHKSSEEDDMDEPVQNSGLHRLTLKEKNAKIREFFSMTCQICGEPFETLGKAKKHYRITHNVPGYVFCCGRKFHRHSTALNHIFFHLNPDAFRCDICGKRLLDKDTLKIHIKNHEAEHEADSSLEFECDLCPKSFTRECRLIGHKQFVHSPVKCDQCDMVYPSKSKLVTHLRNAHQSKVTIPQVCDICGRNFSSKYILLAHVKTQHSAIENPKLQCDICGAWSKNKPHLAKHMERHVEGPAKCSICSKVLSNKFSLSSHMRYVHVEPRHHCTICDKKFRTRLILKEHIASHTGQDLYECAYCTKTFKSSANLYSHRKKIHLAEWTQDCPKKRVIFKKISVK